MTTTENHGHPAKFTVVKVTRETWRRVPPLHFGRGGTRDGNSFTERWAQGGNPHFLLILEEPQDIETYGAFLRASGYKTLPCTSPTEGINFLETEPFSLAIVSQGTWAFEGRQVLERSL